MRHGNLDKSDIVPLMDMPEVFPGAMSILLKQHAAKDNEPNLCKT